MIKRIGHLVQYDKHSCELKIQLKMLSENVVCCIFFIKPLKRQSWLQQTTNFATSLLIFERNKEWYFMRIVCQQTILMKYHALFVVFEKAAKFEIVVCCKL